MKLSALILSCALLALSGAQGAAHEYKHGTIEIVHPWARATPKGATVASGYVTLTNRGAAPDRLVGGSVEFAARLEIHEMKMTDGVMRMRPLPQGVEIRPGETVELKPGGMHLMFPGLKWPLQEAEIVKGALVFQRAGKIEIEFMVEAIGAQPAPHPSHSR
jgi:hypothetical protein